MNVKAFDQISIRRAENGLIVDYRQDPSIRATEERRVFVDYWEFSEWLRIAILGEEKPHISDVGKLIGGLSIPEHDTMIATSWPHTKVNSEDGD